MTQTLHVTVTPKTPSGHDVPVSVAGQGVNNCGDICLRENQDYDIVFTLAGAHGVHGWASNDAFEAEAAGGGCPTKGTGACTPFSVTQGPGPNKITVHVAAQANSSRTEYRLNYNGEYTSDPVIIIGSA